MIRFFIGHYASNIITCTAVKLLITESIDKQHKVVHLSRSTFQNLHQLDKLAFYQVLLEQVLPTLVKFDYYHRTQADSQLLNTIAENMKSNKMFSQCIYLTFKHESCPFACFRYCANMLVGNVQTLSFICTTLIRATLNKFWLISSAGIIFIYIGIYNY